MCDLQHNADEAYLFLRSRMYDAQEGKFKGVKVEVMSCFYYNCMMKMVFP